MKELKTYRLFKRAPDGKLNTVQFVVTFAAQSL